MGCSRRLYVFLPHSLPLTLTHRRTPPSPPPSPPPPLLAPFVELLHPRSSPGKWFPCPFQSHPPSHPHPMLSMPQPRPHTRQLAPSTLPPHTPHPRNLQSCRRNPPGTVEGGGGASAREIFFFFLSLPSVPSYFSSTSHAQLFPLTIEPLFSPLRPPPFPPSQRAPPCQPATLRVFPSARFRLVLTLKNYILIAVFVSRFCAFCRSLYIYMPNLYIFRSFSFYTLRGFLSLHLWAFSI